MADDEFARPMGMTDRQRTGGNARVTVVGAELAQPPAIPLTPLPAARSVAPATSRRGVQHQRGSSAATPAVAGTGSRRAERSS
ncbi:hypothetical protein SAMN05660657_04938 [Geodermatophilus amargosae]|uniref:Uncharacterized protein n=1 Tax=Geodermatophilus amargosae TaxID=1296565 RepID=A0A1I7CVL6_9ACTN|nr:hypothetical protein SAMN05660657_04938 [Geodermatophilus amargosae]